MTPAQITALRNALGLTRQMFAVRVGVAERTVYRWEQGQATPRGLALRRLQFIARRYVNP